MRTIAVVTLVVLAACSQLGTSSSKDAGTVDAALAMDAGEDMGTPDAGTPDAGLIISQTPTLEELQAAWAQVECHVFACVKRARETPEVCALAGQAKGWPFDVFERTQASITAGRGTYNQERGIACANFLRSVDTGANCMGPNAPTFAAQSKDQFDASCGALLTGTVAEMAACESSSECAGGGVCDRTRNPNCEGRCLVLLNAGDSCTTRTQDCAAQRYCDGTICRWRDLKNNGEFCVSNQDCRSDKCFDYACKDASGTGGECVGEGDCTAGLYCRALPPSTGHEGVCQVPSGTAQACGYALKCGGNQACAGWNLKLSGGSKDGVCQAFPSAVGAACVPLDATYDRGDTGCFADLTCNPMTMLCEEAPAVGAACAMPGNRCGMDAYCDETSVCRALKEDGQMASAAVQCRDAFNSFSMLCFDPATQACGG